MKIDPQKHAQLTLDIPSTGYLKQMPLYFQLHFIFRLKTIQYLKYFFGPWGFDIARV